MAGFDLHLHTEWSYDAENHIEEYFSVARKNGLRAIAITDHHLMDGYGEVLETAAKYPEVGYLSGGELTVHCDMGDIDLVCLNLPRRPTPELVKLFDVYRKWQQAYGHALSENFCARGFQLDDAARMKLLESYRPAKAIAKQGNSHVQYRALWNYCVQHGFCKDKAEYDKIRRTFTDLPDYPSYELVIPAVKKAGGVIIMAHPLGYFPCDDTRSLDRLHELFGFDGIECSQMRVTAEMSRFYRDYCLKRKLLSSAGSDLHNTVNEEKFGVTFAEERWLDEILERVEIYHGA